MQAIESRKQSQRESVAAQEQIDELATARSETHRRYLEILRQIDLQSADNALLEQQIAAQRQQLDTYHQIQLTSHKTTPLLLKMVAVLETTISLDQPFHLSQRHAQVAELRKALDAPDPKTGEIYHRIMEAYRGETAYGYTLEAYNGVLENREPPVAVEFLRVGRLNVFYLSRDGNEAGVWDMKQGTWQQLPDDVIPALIRGIQIASKEAPPELIPLPMPAPDSSQ